VELIDAENTMGKGARSTFVWQVAPIRCAGKRQTADRAAQRDAFFSLPALENRAGFPLVLTRIVSTAAAGSDFRQRPVLRGWLFSGVEDRSESEASATGAGQMLSGKSVEGPMARLVAGPHQRKGCGRTGKQKNAI
jgi:hypothetical protein